MLLVPFAACTAAKSGRKAKIAATSCMLPLAGVFCSRLHQLPLYALARNILLKIPSALCGQSVSQSHHQVPLRGTRDNQ